ncbi:MAG: DUF4214 domain-containing protein [Lachnospiraceae bacterium]|nr:DUF4214 domain-containing protein [Lachnospiraceae bacterium]
MEATGQYRNWDGVTNVAQFQGPDGNLWYAVDSDSAVTVYRTNNGVPVSGSVTLTKQHPIFGTCLSDSSGNLYLVTGETNTTDDTSRETIFISKYDSQGHHLATTGDNGSSSLAGYYGDEFYTKIPFDGGNCDAAISGNVLSVHYAREMYSGHQSNSVFSVNIGDMSKVNVGTFYESHSFAQRVVPTANGFVYMSEGDCYDRTFTACAVNLSGGTVNEGGVFDFWVEDGAFDAYDMYVVNENFAHMGGLAPLSNGKVAFVAQSVQSLNANAENESEEIFIQIFDPFGNLADSSAYTTVGTRSGLAGNNGRTNVTNYGVKWLSSYGTDYAISNVQTVVTEDQRIIVLYELSRGYTYEGVYYMVLDANGNVTRSATLFSTSARLNPCEMPVCDNGKVYWAGNNQNDSNGKLYIYSLDPVLATASYTSEVLAKTGLTYNGTGQTLVTAGAANGGTVQYALGVSGSSVPATGWSASVPQGVDAGTYYVYYRLAGDASHFDIDPAYVTVTIGRKNISVSANDIRKAYGESDPALTYTVTGLAQGDSLTGTLSRSAGESVGEYRIRQGSLSAGDNYVLAFTEAVLTIEKAAPVLRKAPAALQLTYNGSWQDLVSEGETEDGYLLYALGTEKDVPPSSDSYSYGVPYAYAEGTYYVWYKISGDRNHLDSAPVQLVVRIAAPGSTPTPGPTPTSTPTPTPTPDPTPGSGDTPSADSSEEVSEEDQFPYVDIYDQTPNGRVHAFVARMYAFILNRAPETEGIEFWSDLILNHGMPAAECAKFFVLESDEFLRANVNNDVFLSRMYKTFFGEGRNRTNDPEGFAFWKTTLEQGYSRKWVLAGFVSSGEFSGICESYGITRGEIALTEADNQPSDANLYVDEAKVNAYVERLYNTILNRPAEAGGKEFWAGLISGHEMTAQRVAVEGFFFSEEYLAKNTSNREFVNTLYLSLLNRNPADDPDGFAFWVSALDNGMDRMTVIEQGFGDSPEFRGILQSYGLLRK